MRSLDAQRILLQLGQLEFPFTFEKGLQFALFRTYGVPSISSLLASTSLFSSPTTSCKRYTDTVVLISEFVSREYGSKAWTRAVARMNCIHGEYERKGRISNEDMLYTLALFAQEPMAWIERWEWRGLSEVERNALGVFWAAVGEAMGIEYTGLITSYEDGTFMNGLEFLAELCDWAKEYEGRHMVPDEKNHLVAEQTMALLLWLVPGPLKGVARKAVFTLMDKRLRVAMLYPDPPAWLVHVVHGAIHFRGLVVRHLFPPRYSFAKYQTIFAEPSESGRSFMLDYLALPYYVHPTLANRWGFGALTRRIQGLPVPGEQGQSFCPMGYAVPDVGPGHGKKEQEAVEERVAQIVAASPYPSSFAASHEL
ncbi:MAG: hypothetical protein LQ340_001699 [Diploschistes diacapsis]|nr:MAG: hypothetical protein LQ340_001699 [Diploschistes diacapsis]